MLLSWPKLYKTEMKLLVIDNYDSFTWNLVYLVRELGYGDSMEVHRNDKFDIDFVEGFDKIMLSPGPGIPSEAGLMMDVIKRYAPTKKILGVCLGHQGIGEAFGAKLHNLQTVLHGIKGKGIILKPENKLFKDIPSEIAIAHYHSWVVSREDLPEELEITAENPEGLIMGLRHKEYDVQGLQFHPESILTDFGKEIISNWLSD